MKKRLHCYVRVHRRRWGFTQSQLAFILGTKGNTCISRLEDGKAVPTQAILLALHVMFDTGPHELFPALYSEIEEDVLTRAYDLYDQLQGGRSATIRRKLDFLEGMFERAKRRSKTYA